MKIVCESCGAKYSIADEKVAGKVFKIRCKRCSEVIVVRGDEDASASQSAAPAAYDAAPEAVWHVVINGDQQGPYSPVQLGEMLTNGTIDWEAYVWMEGFDNWSPMRDVENLVADITGGGSSGGGEAHSSAVPTAAGGFGVEADPYASQASMGADPFADDGDAGGYGGGMEPAASGPDLFGGGAAASPFDGGSSEGVVSSSSSPRVDAAQAMTGTRNENSVLFSLKNLQALATGSSTPSAAPASANIAGNQSGAGFATGEGSGLIDIRALASATGMGNAADEGGEEKDELLSMGSQTAAFGALGASPMLATASEESEGGSKTVLIASIVGGAVVLAAGMVAFAMLSRPTTDPAQQQVVATQAAPAAAAPTPAAAPATPEPAAEEPVGEGAKAAAAEDEDKDEDDNDSDADKERRRKRREARRRDSSSGSSSAKPESEPAPARAKAKPKPRAKGGDSLDDLLSGAIGGGAPAAKKAPANNLPDAPTKGQVLKALKGVESGVKACAKGASGVAIVNITVKGKTGRVTGAQVQGQTGAVGSCIARAVRKAKFPKFQNATFKVKYPFRL